MLKNLLQQKFLWLIGLAVLPLRAIAEQAGLGVVADNLMTPVSIVSNFMYSASLVIGITALFASFLKYMQHRVNPLAHPMGTVVLLLLLGVVLICLPLISHLTESGIPIGLHN